MKYSEFVADVDLRPELYDLAWANERARGADVDGSAMSEAIYVKALAEGLEEPAGTFYELENLQTNDVLVGNPAEADTTGNVRFRPFFSLRDMRLASTLERELDYRLDAGELYVYFGAMKYSEVGRYQQVGDNIVARRGDGRLIMAPDLPVVRGRLNAANFQPYEADEFSDWNGFTFSAPKPGEVPLERKGYSDSSGHRVAADWRKALKYWQQEQDKWEAEHQQQAAVAGAATALMVDGQRGAVIAGADRTQLMPQGPATAMFDMQRTRLIAGANQTRVFSPADRADARGQARETRVNDFEAASTIGRVLETAARDINTIMNRVLRGEPIPQLGEAQAEIIDAVLSIIADREPQHENDAEPQAASDALEVFRASQRRYEQ